MILKKKSSNKKDVDQKDPSQKVAIFIDGSNFYHSLEENCKRVDVDFLAFARKLCDGRSLYRTYYYNVLRDVERNQQAYHDQQKFLSTLYAIPYFDVRLGKAKLRGDIAVEKGIDIMLATDLLNFAWSKLYDVAILVSGDGDFAYAVQAIKNIGHYVEVAAFSANLSSDLGRVADEHNLLTPEFFSDLWTQKNGGLRADKRIADKRASVKKTSDKRASVKRTDDKKPGDTSRSWWRSNQTPR